jgi:two-component system chemotaxis sensor kinase CheA
VVTIQQRLMALIVASMLVVVGVLTWQQASSRLDDIHSWLRRKASTYSQLVGKQVLSAVAFSDRETAREVLEGLESDRDVAGIRLLGANGVVLFAYGPAVVAARDVVRETTPVVSLEGPEGVLTIELSTRSAQAARARVIEISLVAGGIALACSTLMAWLIARGIARRLRAISCVVTAVAGGDLEQPPIDDTRGDEVSALASAFNAMVGQLKQLLDRVRELARKEQDRLEALVAERTDALEARTRQMRLVFDQVDQGLLVIDLDGTIASDHSAVVERWLGAMPVSHHVVDLVRSFEPARADWFALAWGSLGAGLLPVELAVTQLPSSFTSDGRQLVWSYKPFELANGNTRILVVISDVTAQLARGRDEQRERETVSLLSRALRDRAGFVESCAETARLVAAIESTDAASVTFARDVHTLKGVSGFLELTSIADACHALESARADRDDSRVVEERVAIITRWRELAALAEPFLDGTRNRLDVTERDVAELEAAIARGASSRELAELATSWRDERAVDRLVRVAELARTLAARAGKAPIDVTVECAPNLRVRGRLAPLWSTLAHVVRNSIDHGLERSDERARTGKPMVPKLTLRAEVRSGGLVLELADDGRGIAWDRVAALAASRGFAVATREDLEAALFADGVSTAAQVSELSGRGVGLSALHAAAEALGARTSISSEYGLGTTLRIAWPRDSHEAPIAARGESCAAH